MHSLLACEKALAVPASMGDTVDSRGGQAEHGGDSELRERSSQKPGGGQLIHHDRTDPRGDGYVRRPEWDTNDVGLVLRVPGWRFEGACDRKEMQSENLRTQRQAAKVIA